MPLSEDAKHSIARATVSLIILGVAVGIVVMMVNKQYPSSDAPREPVAKVPPMVVNGAPVNALEKLACSPLTPGYTGLVACTKQGTCARCKEATDATGAYACASVYTANGAVDENGLLKEPKRIKFTAPPSSLPCSGYGKLVNGQCQCDANFSGAACELYSADIFTPGSFCLPAYAVNCDSPTTMSVYTNYNTGSGGQYTCACKPEYVGQFVQTTSGGLCDTPLICNAAAPQMNAAQTEPQLYAVNSGTLVDGSPLFTPQPVYTNRIASFDVYNPEPCIAKTTTTTNGRGTLTYPEVKIALDADPTCTPELQSNLCVAIGQTGTVVNVRGSNRPGDPLKTRVSPGFYAPVPPGLQRCPDGFTGNNTPESPCTDKDNKKLQLRTLSTSYCKNPNDLTATTPRTYSTTWSPAVFDSDGEWNGAFTCLHDLRNAKARVGDTGVEVDVSSLPWTTVNGTTAINEVKCMSGYNTSEWLYRSDYDATTKTFPQSKACVGPSCAGVQGNRVRTWNGDRDGPLVNEQGNPWFAAPQVPGTVAQPSFGGQCDCSGTVFRRATPAGVTCAAGKCAYLPGDPLSYLNGTPCSTANDCVTVATPMVPLRVNPDGGSDTWWACGADPCWSPQTPLSTLDASDPEFPKCTCITGSGGSKSAPFNSHISYRPRGGMPQCIPDPCNPYGFHAKSKITCAADEGCQGKCFNNKCHYPISGDAQTCTTDAQCTSLSYAANTGRCVPVTFSDGTTGNVCAYEDVDREAAGTFCSADTDCSFGRCVTTGSDAFGLPIERTCSGACACSKDAVQVKQDENPVGFTCKRRCELTPCQNGSVCSIDANGQQQCACPPCYTGDKCQYTTGESRRGEACDFNNSVKNSARVTGTCCEGTCTKKVSGSANGICE